MKTSALLLITLLSFSYTGTEKQEGASQRIASVANDKDYLLDYFQETTDNLQESIAGLSKAQMQFKPSADRWSISQCLEHIILTEKVLFEMTKEQMQKPANPERKKELKVKDEELIAGMKDRSSKAKASKELQGDGRYNDPETAMKNFIKQREEILSYIKSTPVDSMRNHITDSPFGPIDGDQSCLFIAGHVARHTLQIEEVKTAADFP
ncbi:MAG: DinB family protein, partial [Fulvivirga sp.]